MAQDSILKTLNAARGMFLKQVKDLSEEQLLVVPEGSKNNVLWNIGHITYSNCALTYRPCGLALPVPDNYLDLFKSGTSPEDWNEIPAIDEVMGNFKTLTAKTSEDYKAGKFGEYNKVDLFDGYSLESIEDALCFNIFHESVHIGTVAKLVKQLNAVKA